MLYISRYFGVGRYGVVDTDDGVEQVVTKKELVNSLNLGCEIRGASDENTIRVYQPTETRSQLQVKTYALLRVDIKTYKDCIVDISFDPNQITNPVTLRLSDYGKKCGDYLLAYTKQAAKHKVTLILDDKIGFGKKSFWIPPSNNLEAFGLNIDIRELCDDTALIFYSSVYLKYISRWYYGIIDDDKRKVRMVMRMKQS